jgi:hypothetical protein
MQIITGLNDTGTLNTTFRQALFRTLSFNVGLNDVIITSLSPIFFVNAINNLDNTENRAVNIEYNIIFATNLSASTVTQKLITSGNTGVFASALAEYTNFPKLRIVESTASENPIISTPSGQNTAGNCYSTNIHHTDTHACIHTKHIHTY